jgi:uncharacterized protein (TIGR02453 family)
MPTYFSPSLFTFLRQLKANNRREWFAANRARYVADVEAPMLRFIHDLAPHLRRISPAFVVDARRTGGSMFRIYRDTRFSADKSPYKTNVAASFAHERRKSVPGGVPGFYLHLEPGDSMGGGGIYHPDAATLTRIRRRIMENAKSWAAVKRSGFEIEGDRLARSPAGVSPDHRFIDDLRLKDLYTLTPFSQPEVCAADFLDRYMETCTRAAPLVAFLTKALEWRW